MAGKLTKKQLMFSQAVARGSKPHIAAGAAGYAHPSVDAYKLMRHPAVISDIKTRRESLIQGDLAAIAIDTMRDLMGNETPAATRYQASKWVLEHAGHANPADAEKGQTKDLTYMNADELAQAISSGMQALGELSQQLKGTHNIDGEIRQVRELEVLDDEEAEDADYVESDDSDADFLD